MTNPTCPNCGAELRGYGQWTDIQETPPDFSGEDVPIIAHFEDGSIGEATYHGEGIYSALRQYASGNSITLTREIVTYDIVHWMPLPPPPKEVISE